MSDDDLPALGSGKKVKGKPDRVTQGIVVALMLGLAVMAWQEMRETETLETGKKAPDMILQRLDGSTFDLSSLKGKVVLLDFWAAYCGPCQKEMPWLVKLAKRYEEKGVAFVALNTEESRERSSNAYKFIANLPELREYAAFAPSDVAYLYRIVALPTLYVLDRDGNVHAVRVGAVSQGQVESLLDDALAD